MFKPGDLITSKKEHLNTVHKVIDYDPSTGIITTIIHSGPGTGSKCKLTRPENYKKHEEK